MIAIIHTEDDNSDRFEWTVDMADDLNHLASRFKASGDVGGIHLCAVVEYEAAQYSAGARQCPVGLMYYLAHAMMRVADEADHDLAHIHYPAIQTMMADATHEGQLRYLKREAGINTPDA